MQYRLKKESNEFQVVREGEFEYKHFRHGEIYDRIPDEESDRFEESEIEKAGSATQYESISTEPISDNS